MAGRFKRYEDLAHPLALLAELRPARDAINRAKGHVRPFGPTYLALDAVSTAVDALAAHLGHPDHFLDDLHRTP